MTIVNVYAAADFLDGDAGFYGDVLFYNNSLIRIGDAYGNSNDWYGSFQYDANDNLVGGTVTGVKAYDSYVLTVEVSGANVPALEVAAAVTSGQFFDLYVTVLAGADTISGSGQADRIAGFSGADLISAGGGNDIVYGGSGNDRIHGEFGADRLFGGSGNDAIYGQGGSDTLFGEGGADQLVGAAGRDRLLGGAGGDHLFGGAGRDVLAGQLGSDILTGGGGGDRFQFQKGAGADRITDFQIGLDVIEIGRGARSLADLNFQRAGGDTIVSFANVEILVENVGVLELRDASNFDF